VGAALMAMHRLGEGIVIARERLKIVKFDEKFI
jgi:hypothetical protein